MRLLLAILILLATLAPAVQAQGGASPNARYDYDVPDGMDDVVVYRNGSGVEHKPVTPPFDIVRMKTATNATHLIVTIAFAAPLPASGLDSELRIELADPGRQPLPVTVSFKDERAANFNTDKYGASASIDADTATIAVPLDALEGATCFAPRFKLLLETTASGVRERFEDEVSLSLHRCGPVSATITRDESGMDGTCPPAKPPAGIALDGSWADARGDARAGSPSATVDRSDVDLVRVASKREGDVVALTAELARLPEGTNSTLIQFRVYVEAAPDEVSELFGRDNVHVSVGSFETEAHGTTTDVVTIGEDEATGTRFFAWGSRDGSAVTARFCASLVPADALCWGVTAHASAFDSLRAYDDLEFAWDEGPCAGKVRAGTKSATDSTPAAITREAGGDEDTGAEAEEAETPFGGAALVLLAALVGLALSRRA